MGEYLLLNICMWCLLYLGSSILCNTISVFLERTFVANLWGGCRTIFLCLDCSSFGLDWCLYSRLVSLILTVYIVMLVELLLHIVLVNLVFKSEWFGLFIVNLSKQKQLDPHRWLYLHFFGPLEACSTPHQWVLKY